MRVLVYTPCFPPDHAAYVHLIDNLTVDLVRAGHEVLVISTTTYSRPGRYGLKPWVRQHLGRVEIIRINTFPSRQRGMLRKAVAFGYFTVLSFLVGLFVTRPDLVFAASTPPTMGMVGGGVARLRRVPFVYNVQDIFPDVAIKLGVLSSPVLIRWALWMERMSYRLSAAVSVISPEFADVLQKKGVPADKLVVVPNWIDTDAMTPPPKAENQFAIEHGIQGRFVILYAGNFGLSQGLETLVDAAGLLTDVPNVCFLLVGDGERRQHLEDYVAVHGMGNVRILPFQPQERLHEVFGAADIGIVPLRRGLTSDSIPSKTWTMMAAGLPILGALDPQSALGRFLVEQGTGCVVEPESAEHLADMIRQMYQTPDRIREMGSRSRRFTEQEISRREMTRRYNVLFERLVTRHNRRC